MEIAVGRNHVAYIDATDYPLVSGYKWSACRNRNTIYARRRWHIDGHTHYQFMHVLIMGVTGIDHADRNGLNNRRSNLRVATNRQNQGNRRCQSHSSIYKGVCWAADRRKWRASIVLPDGRTWSLGGFDDEIDAARAYDRAAREVFGDYARVSFP